MTSKALKPIPNPVSNPAVRQLLKPTNRKALADCLTCPIYRHCQRKESEPKYCQHRPAPFCKLHLPDDEMPYKAFRDMARMEHEIRLGTGDKND